MLRTKNIILVSVFLAICIAMVALFSIFTDNTDIIDEYLLEDSITFTPDSGEPYKIDNISSIEVRYDGVYTSVFTLKSDEESYSTLSLLIGVGEAKLSIDGEVLYSGELKSNDSMIGTPEIQVNVGNFDTEKTVVATVRYTDPDSYIFPALLIIRKPQEIERHDASIVNISAILAGISGVTFILTIALFLLSISLSSPDYSLLFLALGIISFCVCRLFNTGAFICPDSLYFLIYYVLPYSIAPLVLIHIILSRKKKVLKYILIISALLSVLIILANILVYIFDKVPSAFDKLKSLAWFVYKTPFENVIIFASHYLILICVAAEMIYHVKNIVIIQTEKTALKSQNHAIASGYKVMVNSVRKTAEVRHEWKHDLLTLSMLYKQGKISDIGNYLEEKNKFLNDTESVHFTENFVFDVILNSTTSRAANEGVKFKTYVNIPAKINIKDEDLCQLLMNMFDNAFSACAEVSTNKYINFKAEIKNGFLVINCSNSTLEKYSENKVENDFSHGYGLKNMREICLRYGSDLIIKRTETEFTVKTALQVNNN